MAINVHLEDSKLRMTFSEGVDGNGNELKKTRTYSSIKPETLDEDVYAVADTFGSLQKNPVLRIARVDEKEITETVA